MKALKEKRVSLRSLFRRSLVILSLLALAFAVASCGGGSDTGSTDETDPTVTEPATTGPENPDPEIPRVPMIKSMTVLKHPTNPSYEGAHPDLTGLEVLVKWEEGSDKPEETVTDPTRFAIYPPVAYVTAGSADTGGGGGDFFENYSPYGRYGIQLRDDDDIFSENTYRVNVYLPAVISLSYNDVVTEAQVKADPTRVQTPRVDGKLGAVYEDIGIGVDATAGVNYVGTYSTFDPAVYMNRNYNAGAVRLPYDSGYSADIVVAADGTPYYSFMVEKKKNSAGVEEVVLRKEWKKVETGTGQEHTYAVSPNPEAWKIDTRSSGTPGIPTTSGENKATYKIQNSAIAVDFPNVEISKYFRVDRLDFDPDENVEEFKKISVVAADDSKYGGNNVERSIAANGRDIVDTITSGDKDLKVLQNWWNRLLEANLKFKVTYYLEKADGKDPTVMATRYIRMADYVRAMYTVREDDGTPRATLPLFTGADLTYTNPKVKTAATQVDNPSSPQYWAYLDGDFNLYMTLFYYSDFIEVYNPLLNGTDYRNGIGYGRPMQNAYLEGNGATIPIATEEVHKVATFRGFRSDEGTDAKGNPYSDRKDGSAHEGEPTIYGYSVKSEPDTAAGRGPVGASPSASAVVQTRWPRNRQFLYEQLQKYWEPRWLYDNLEDPDDDSITIKVPRWYTFNGQGGTTAIDKYEKVGLADYDFDDIETIERRQCEVLLPAPPSVGPAEDDSVELWYYVKP